MALVAFQAWMQGTSGRALCFVCFLGDPTLRVFQSSKPTFLDKMSFKIEKLRGDGAM